MALLSLVAGVESALSDRLSGEVLPGLESTLQRLTAASGDWLELLSQVYVDEAGGGAEPFGDRAERLRQAISDGSVSLILELRTAEELQGGLAAYAAGNSGTGERILLNADWGATASDADLERVLLEELGHAFDQRLNPDLGSQGDAGALFAAQVWLQPLNAVQGTQVSLFQLTGSVGSGDSEPLLAALSEAERLVRQLLSPDAGRTSLFQMFPGGASEPSSQWLAQAEQLVNRLQSGGLSLNVELRASADLLGAYGAFAAAGPSGEPVIYLNEIWVERFSLQELTRLILEETGHWIDNQLNGSSDTIGDEGEAFAATVLGLELSDQAWDRIRRENDTVRLMIDGVDIEVEMAALLFADDAFFIGSSSSSVNTTLETNTVYTYGLVGTNSSDRYLFISDPSADPVFSGNNVRGYLYVVNSSNRVTVRYFGEITRLFKSGSNVIGLQFFTYPPGYVAGSGDRTTPTSNAILIDLGPAGFVSGQSYGTSSDPVDTALNQLLTAAPADAIGDTGIAREKGGVSNATAGFDASGNVVLNDTGGTTNYSIDTVPDPDVMVVSSTSRTVVEAASALTAASGTVASGSTSTAGFTSVAGLYGTLRIGADGSYVYIIDDMLSSVQALRTTSDTLTDTFTYTLSAGGTTDVNSLAITIQGQNDSPIARDDYNQAKESLLSDVSGAYLAADPLGSKAIGNVLDNDTDVDAGDTKSLAGSVTITGSASGTTEGSGAVTFTSTIAANALINGTYNAFKELSAGNYQAIVVGGIQTTLTKSGTGVSLSVTFSSTSGLSVGDKIFALDGVQYRETGVIASIGAVPASTSILVSGQVGSIAVGMAVSGNGITSPTTVTAVTYDASGNLTTVTLSQSVSIAGSALTFTTTDVMNASGISIAGQYGVLNLDASGNYVYTPFTNNPGLSDGEEAVEKFAYMMQDALGAQSPANLVIKVLGSGTNNPNAVSQAVGATEKGGVANAAGGLDPSGSLLTGTSTPSGTITLTGIKTTQDASETVVDPSGSVVDPSGASYNAKITGLYGDLYVKSDGSFYYVVNNGIAAVQALNVGDRLEDVFLYEISNGAGTDVSTLTITIDGANDVPIANPDIATALEAGGVGNSIPGFDPCGNLLTNDTDVDAGDTKTVVSAQQGGAITSATTVGVSETAITGLYGTLFLNRDGTYRYVVDNANSAVESLDSTESLTETFAYRMQDASGATSDSTLVITIDGRDDEVNVSSVNVNEGSPWAVFSVFGEAGQQIRLNLAGDPSGATLNQDFGDPSGSGLEYLDASNNWVPYTSSSVVPLDPSGELLVRVKILPDQLNEGSERFALNVATLDGAVSAGIGNITDDGTGDYFADDNKSLAPSLPSGISLDDDRLLTISNPRVNENSPFAVFKVSGAANQQVRLNMPAVGFGNSADQYDGSSVFVPDGNQDYGPNLQVWDPSGSAWVDYTPDSLVSLDGSGSLLVRTAIYDEKVYETDSSGNGETFRLIGTNTGGLDASGGLATILDNGTGTLFDPSGGPDASGNPTLDPSGALDNDLVDVKVDGGNYNEGAKWAIFAISGIPQEAGRGYRLGFSDEGTSLVGPSGEVTCRYSTDGGQTWTNYTADSVILSPGTDVKVLVAVDITAEQDSPYEGEEDFRLTAYDSGDLDVASGVAMIFDDATGLRPALDASGNPRFDSCGNLIETTSGFADDDRSLTASNPIVNENSPYVVFDVSGNANQLVALRLDELTASKFDGSGSPLSDGSDDFGPVIQYRTGSGSWQTYDPSANGGFISLDASGKVQVRTRIYDDTLFESTTNALETFRLVARNTGNISGASDASGGIATILDDGTGDLYDASGNLDPSGAKDNDRPLTVTGGTYNENSPWALFTISKGAPSQLVTLDLSGNTATEWDGSGSLGPSGDPLGLKDFGPTIQYQNPSGDWVDYTEGAVPLDASGNLRVRASLHNDPLFETFGATPSGETFSLVVGALGGSSFPGEAVILDNGQGDLIDASGNLDLSGNKDSDIPSLNVVGPTDAVSEGSPLLFVINISNPLPAATPLQLSLADIDTELNDYSHALSDFQDNQAFYLNPSGGEVFLSIDSSGVLTVPAGVGTVYVRLRSNDDNVYEGLEKLRLDASLPQVPGAPSGFATAGIIDDGTGTPYTGKVDPSGGGPAIDPSLTPDNDIPTLSVQPLTPEISEGTYGLFRVSLTNPLEAAAPLTLSLLPGSGSPQASSTDTAFPAAGTIQISWVDPSSGLVTSRTDGGLDQFGNLQLDYPAGVTDVYIRVLTVQDGVYEGRESFSLQASLDLAPILTSPAILSQFALQLPPLPTLQLTADASANIVDDGTGTPYSGSFDASGNPETLDQLPDNDIPSLAVTSLIPEISEGTKGLFQIDLSKPLAFTAPLNLGLRNDTAESSDYGFLEASGNRVYVLDASNNRQFLSMDGSGNVIVPVGVQRLYVLVNTTQDLVYEGDEKFFLDARLDLPGSVADPSGSAFAVISDDGSAPLYQLDGSNNPVPDVSGNPIGIAGAGDDDRPKTLTISAPGDVSEGSPAVFKVSLDKVSELTLPIQLDLANVSTESDDYQSPVQAGGVFYRDASGNPVTLIQDGSGNFLIPPGVKDFFVRVDTKQDSVYEGLEEFSLTGTLMGIPGLSPTGNGKAGIVDEGSGKVYTGAVDVSGNPVFDPSGTPDDDRGGLTLRTLTPDVSEGSTALFEVTLANALENPTKLKLDLSGITADGTDFGFPPSPQVYYFDASGIQQFLSLDPSGNITVPSLQKKLYVKVATTQDGVYEGQERFKLTGTLTLASQTFSAEADAGIFDDGTGKPYTGALDVSGNPQSSGTPDNDIPSLAVTSLIPEISEGTKGLFRIDLSNPLAFTAPLNLGLRNDTAESSDYGFLEASGNRVYVLDASNNRQFLSMDGSGNVIVPVGVQRLYVLVNTTQDLVYEGDEKFFLDARLDLPGSVADPSGSAFAVIADDGSAPLYQLDGSNNPVPDVSGNPIGIAGAGDDDRPKTLTISAPGDVSEGSPAVFKVSLDKVSDAIQPIQLDLQDVSTEPADYKLPIGLFDVFYTDNLGNPQLLGKDLSGNYLIPGGVKDFYVVVRTVDDDVYEGLEKVALKGALLNLPGVTGSGEAGIIDDGTGKPYNGLLDPSGNPDVDPSGVSDDDRGGLIVTTLTPDVSEGSTALFSVKLANLLADATPLNLKLTGLTAEANDYSFDPNGLQVSYYNASGSLVALSLDLSGNITVPAGITQLYVKVLTTQDTSYEGPETFLLNASLLGAGFPSDADEATIRDDGQGKPYTGILDPSGNPVVDPSGAPDNDLPRLTVTAVTPKVSEGQKSLFSVVLSNSLEAATPLRLTLANGSAESDDYGFPAGSQVYVLDGSGIPQFLTIDPSSGTIAVQPGQKQFFVLVDTTQDQIPEGPEDFRLNAVLDLPGLAPDPSGSASVVIADDGSAPVYKLDGSGNPLIDASGSPVPDPSGVSDDDRELKVSGAVYNEASPYIFWTVKGSGGQVANFVGLSPDSSGADVNADLSGNLQYRDLSGNWQTLDASSNPVLDASGLLLIRKQSVNDTTPEGLEDFRLSVRNTGGIIASGLSSLADNGTGLIPVLDPSGNPSLDASGTPIDDPSKPKDEDRGLTVSGIIYSEASDYLFWTVKGASGQVAKFVALNGDPSGADPNTDLSGNLQYRDASGIWQTFDASSNPVLDASGTLLIRKAVVNDAVPEGQENFTLVVKNTGGTAASAASALIDNGTGLIPVLDPSGNPTLDGSGIPQNDLSKEKDDDRVLAVTGAMYNEASPYMFWTVSGARDQVVTFVALNGDPSGADPNTDLSGNLQYRDASGIWQTFDASSNPVLDASGTLLIRKAVVNDAVPEGQENFTLVVKNTGGTAASAASALIDNGTGLIPVLDPSGNPSLDPSGSPQNDPSKPKDDDRVLAVTGAMYNEASPYMFWTVSGARDQVVKFVALNGDPSGADPNTDLSGNLQYRDASGIWQTFDASSNPVLDASGTLLIRKAVVNDAVPEGQENFTLVVKNTGGTAASAASALIDNGTGLIPVLDPSGNPSLDPSGSPQNDPSKPKDDDRVLAVTGAMYNEASPFVFWTVKGAADQAVKLVGLTPDSSGADVAVDLSGNLQYRDGSGVWQTLDASSNVVLDASGTLLIRKAVVNDDVLEGQDDFRLVVGNTGGTDFAAVSSLSDTGTGLIPALDPSGNPTLDGSGIPQNDPSKEKDDDRLDADEDVDGIPGKVEVELANKVTGNGRGDLNGDGIADNLQPAYAVLAWITVDKFQAALNSTLNEVEPIIALTAVAGSTGSAVDPSLQFTDIEVLPPDSPTVGGGKPTGPFIDAPWDPLTFGIKPLAEGAALTDLDGNSANGTQVRVLIDISRAGVKPGDFNGYQKYVSQQTIDAAKAAGQPLRDLDGNPINAPGWIDFLARLDASGNRISDGARFVVDGGFVQAFELVFTDNKFGDNSALVNFIQDPNLPVKIAQSQLVPTKDGKGLEVVGYPGEILWVDMSAVLADASHQNGFELVRVRDGKSVNLGAIGATPDSGFFGDSRVELVVGDVLNFVQVSGNLGRNLNPDVEISGDDNCVIVNLDDNGGDGDANDLVLKLKTSEADPYPRTTQMARYQTGSELAYLDLSWIGADGITLNLDVKTDGGQSNTIRLVKVDTDANGVPLGTVGGFAPSAGAAFDQAVISRLLPNNSFSQSGQTTGQTTFQLTGAQAGVYAPVVITENGTVYTFGAASSSDGRQHVKVLGANSFAFEDAPNGIADWDFNDTAVSFKASDPTSPRLVLSTDTHGLTVVGGSGPADGLWLDLRAIMADAGKQNSFDLLKFDASGTLIGPVGGVGATSQGTFLGGKEVFLAVGETLRFAQNSNNDAAPSGAIDLRITQIGERFRVALNDEEGSGDGDYNDLVVDVDRTTIEPCEEVVKLADLQRTSSDGILDLSWISDGGITLNMSILTDSGNANTLKFVKLDVDASGAYSVDGVAAGNTEAFRSKLLDVDNLTDFEVTAGGEGVEKTAAWKVAGADKGVYAAVLFTEDGNVFTFGDNTALDGTQHLKVLGDNSFAFEDVLANKTADYDYDDFVVRITPAL